MAKNSLFKGLAATFGLLLPITVQMSVLAFDREGDINLFLGVGGDISASSGRYKSAYASLDELRLAEIDYEIDTMAEGSVLLRNENNALPLASGKRKVTLFGNAAAYPSYHGGSGGPSNTGISLKEALVGEGFLINEAVYKKIEENGKRPLDHDIAEVDPSIYSASDIGDYKDAAIVVIGRYGGENNDMDVEDKYGVPELSLHEQERQMLEFVKAQGFEKVIVLLNTGYTMETGWIRDYADAALWIAYPGQYGFKGVAKLLTGERNPSGRLVDLYPADIFSSPAMQNFGDFKFADLAKDLFHHEYVVYTEGIYSGYKYYETRYADLVKGEGNADSDKGSTGTGAWNYAEEVVYPFGYGLSYASFSEKLDSIEWDRTNHEVVASVTVKNESTSVSAKRSVPLYASTPYQAGQAEQSAISLIGFAKTKELAPGESETLQIKAPDYLFATYDEKATNGADPSKKGCYVFYEGNYCFSIGEDSHDALNNILALQNATGLYDQNGNTVYGNAAKARSIHLDSYDNVTHAKNQITGEAVYNRFQDVDINHFIPNSVTYLTREDWNTFPEPVLGLKAGDDASGEITKHMTAFSSLYVKPADAPDYKTFKHSTDAGIKFVEMAEVPYSDNEKWETFLDQLTVAELTNIPGEKMANDAVESVAYPKNTSGDGPDGLQSGGILHPSETLAAASFNLEILAKRGYFLAEDALYAGLSMVYGGGCNLHRTPYSGRNFEYYSEDSNLSYICGRAQGKAMSDKGLIGAFKHFLGNDQETNRHGVATFMTEQTLRQGDARGFEGALTDGAALGNMGAYNRIGILPTSSCKALMTDLLRTEWGFKGISITDSSKDASSYIFTADAVDAGTTLFNNDFDRGAECKTILTKNRDGHIWKCLREQVKNFFYAYSRSNLINNITVETTVSSSMVWWKVALIAINVSLGVLFLGSLAGYAVFTLKKRKEAK